MTHAARKPPTCQKSQPNLSARKTGNDNEEVTVSSAATPSEDANCSRCTGDQRDEESAEQ